MKAHVLLGLFRAELCSLLLSEDVHVSILSAVQALVCPTLICPIIIVIIFIKSSSHLRINFDTTSGCWMK